MKPRPHFNSFCQFYFAVWNHSKQGEGIPGVIHAFSVSQGQIFSSWVTVTFIHWVCEWCAISCKNPFSFLCWRWRLWPYPEFLAIPSIVLLSHFKWKDLSKVRRQCTSTMFREFQFFLNAASLSRESTTATSVNFKNQTGLRMLIKHLIQSIKWHSLNT